MRNINILINEDHTVSFENDYAGLNRENLQGNIVFSFKNFVDGTARAEVIIDDEDGYIYLEKVGQTYQMPIKSSLLKSDFIIMQLVIDQEEVDEEIPVWKSECFTLKVGCSINATTQIPDDYPTWVEILENLKDEVEDAVEQAENVNITSEQLDNGVKVITTDKNGIETTTIVPQGPQGPVGPAGAIKTIVVDTLPTENIDTTAIYLVPSSTPGTSNTYDEYMYINNNWEKLGGNVVIDLTNYVQFTDLPSGTKTGVIKKDTWYGYDVNSSGALYSGVISYSNYSARPNEMFISKGTLENVITGKDLTTKSYVDGLVGDINSVLDAINGEVI